MKYFITIIVFLLSISAGFYITESHASYDQAAMAAQSTSCNGPKQLCDQVTQLRTQLNKAQGKTEKTDEKFIGMMASIAVGLKILISLAQKWKEDLFKSEKGKLYLHLSIAALSIVIFVVSNMGLGMTFWQSIILALGGPLSSYVHEIVKTTKKLRKTKQVINNEQ